MDFQTIEIAFLARTIPPKGFILIDFAPWNANIIANRDRTTIEHKDGFILCLFPELSQALEQNFEYTCERVQPSVELRHPQFFGQG